MPSYPSCQANETEYGNHNDDEADQINNAVHTISPVLALPEYSDETRRRKHKQGHPRVDLKSALRPPLCMTEGMP